MGEEKNINTENKEDKLDRLLSKYVSVWLWSILFGATSGLGISFLTFNQYELEKWGILSLLIVVLVVIGLVVSLFSLFGLFYYFTRYLIPQFILFKNIYEDKESNRMAAFQLKRALSFMITALVIRVIIIIVEMLYTSLGTYLK